MRKYLLFFLLSSVFIIACDNNRAQSNVTAFTNDSLFIEKGKNAADPDRIDTLMQEGVNYFPDSMRIQSRFLPPYPYVRDIYPENSFAFYLRTLPLKSDSSYVYYYDGFPKLSLGLVYQAVIDMEISAVDLQQCADAVMRLRGEYLYAQKKYDSIHFNFLSDGKPRYYQDYVKGDYSYKRFRKYMDWIFSYANTRSLDLELSQRKLEDIHAGDVFIESFSGGIGHAVIVLDVATNPKNGKKIFMLAQSYMPAQETQVLVNPENPDLSPWYELDTTLHLMTPEYDFRWSQLNHF